MHDISQQSPKVQSSAGYRPFVSSGPTRDSRSSARAYVAAVAGLGLMIGSAIAFTGCRAHPAAAPKPASTASAHPSSVKPLPAVNPMPAPSLLSQVGDQKKPVVGSPLLKRVSLSPKKPAQAQKELSVPRVWPVKHISEKHDTVARRPYVAPIPPAVPAPQPVFSRATAPAPAGAFFLAIEGELTVASYDEAAGNIETYEGSNFVLDPASSSGDGIPWQDFPFNVHYRCEESGKCILVRGTETAIARMTR